MTMTRRKVTVPATVWSQLGAVPVRVVTPCIHPDGEEVRGWCDYHNRILYVDGAQAIEAQVQTVLHEAMHLWLDDASISLGRKEDQAVNIIGNGAFNLLYGPRR